MTEKIYNPLFVKELFNRMAGSYERMNYITSFGFSLKWRTQFIKKLSYTEDNLQAIDLLTGMGETWQAAKKHFPNSTLSALDFSEGMLKNARKKNHAQFNNSVLLFQQDILHSNLPADYYDYVFCAFGLKTFDKGQLNIIAKEIKRILKKGGEFSFIELSVPENKVLRGLFGFYLGKIVPVIGRLLLGNPSEYRMLWKYTRQFKNAKEVTAIFNATSLQATYNTYFYGCATGFSGKK